MMVKQDERSIQLSWQVVCDETRVELRRAYTHPLSHWHPAIRLPSVAFNTE